LLLTVEEVVDNATSTTTTRETDIMEQFADRIPLEVVTYRSEKTRSEAKDKADARAKELTKVSGRKHSYRHAEKLDRTVYEIFAIDREPIEMAVAPLKDAAIQRAEEDARNDIERVRKALEEAGGDLNTASPYPSRHAYGSVAYQTARYRRSLFETLTESSTERYQSYTTDKPYFVEITDARVTRFVEYRKKLAAEEYEMFVAKLISKIGHVVQAELTGNHVWSYSILTVAKPDGKIEKWKTQQITNVSKLGKYFNQWPTRQMKK
jgi:hypothetical protein